MAQSKERRPKPGPVRMTPSARRRATVPAREEDVARRAYEIYLSRGGGPSSEAQAREDWLRAERELRGGGQ